MKRILTLALVLVVMIVFSQSALAQAAMAGSPHDLTSTGLSTYKGSKQEVCVYCHTPHNSASTTLLWNKDAASTTGYTYYETQNSQTSSLTGNSLLCLSCHDGTTAAPSDLNAQSVTGGTVLSGSAVLSSNFTDDHPVGVTYATAEAAGGYVATGSLTGVKLVGGNVECASCHDPHAATSVTHMLRVANTDSDLCTSCHTK